MVMSSSDRKSSEPQTSFPRKHILCVRNTKARSLTSRPEALCIARMRWYRASGLTIRNHRNDSECEIQK